jgi:hypothetical protein
VADKPGVGTTTGRIFGTKMDKRRMSKKAVQGSDFCLICGIVFDNYPLSDEYLRDYRHPATSFDGWGKISYICTPCNRKRHRLDLSIYDFLRYDRLKNVSWDMLKPNVSLVNFLNHDL